MPRQAQPKPQLRRTFLRQWREHRNLTQDQAAERIGLDRSQLSRIENGQSPYNQPFMEAAASAYRCDVADLLMRNPKDKSAIWTLIDAVRDTSPATQRQIQAIVETIIKTGT